jgi:type IV pilus assembly protein PilX
MIERKTQSYRHSQGVILLVSLILLLAMTLIGVAAIDSSSLQSQMSRNSLFARNLYQASLSEIQAQHREMDDLDYLESIHGSATEIPDTITGITTTGPGLQIADVGILTRSATDPFDQSANVVFSGTSSPPSGYSLGLYIGMSYEVNAISEVAGTSSQSDQTQGLKRVAPLAQE